MAQAPALPAVEEPDAAVLPARPGPSRSPRWRSGRNQLLAVLTAVVVIALVMGGLQLRDDGSAALSRADVDRQVAAGVTKARQDERSAPTDAANAYRRILPSLVTITSGLGNGESALGAGVVINAEGAVLTALHVVASSKRIQVRFTDGTKGQGQIVTRRPQSDIAVLAVDNLPDVVVPAVMGGDAQIGADVYPVGNPLGLQGSLSAGVVSGLDRTIRPAEGPTIKGLIQFDAAVNPGNSGGPLLDRNGDVIGIVTALANPSRQPYFVGIGFAVPIATAGGAAGGPSK
jgi:S1-C subfamily serine protease